MAAAEKLPIHALLWLSSPQVTLKAGKYEWICCAVALFTQQPDAEGTVDNPAKRLSAESHKITSIDPT